MAELADALDSGSSEHYAHASSSLVIRITKIVKGLEHLQTLYLHFFNFSSVLTNPAT